MIANPPPLWPHQKEGLDWILERGASYLHLTMGAGKSRIVVTAADECAARLVLIVCPKSVVDGVWPGQFADWSARPWVTVPTTRYGSAIKRRLEKAKKVVDHAQYNRQPVAVVINYDAIRSEHALRFLKSYQWDLVVFDEAQKLKSPRGKTSKAAQSITRRNAKRTVMLSGTPMPHSPMDIFAQFRALDLSVFGGSFIRFRSRYARMGGYKNKVVVGFTNQSEMTERMSELMYSPPADAVKLNLPDARHEIRHVDLSSKARRLYDALNEDVVAAIAEGKITYQNGLVKLLRMQQLCSGLAVVEPQGAIDPAEELTDEQLMLWLDAPDEREEIEVCTAKQDALRDILESTDEPVVVFGQFRRDMANVHAACDALGESAMELSGQRNDLARWRADEGRVLAVQIASGAEGIDLTRARVCVYLSTGFNLGTYLQSLARVHRPGQKRAVVYYHIHARKTVDDVVWRVLQKREDLVKGVLAQVQGQGAQA